MDQWASDISAISPQETRAKKMGEQIVPATLLHRGLY